ncbi:MAG TPA: nucleotidyltransferase family protein [archaeon]|nr:nucleotidyltransferase family protein [archaeon]
MHDPIEREDEIFTILRKFSEQGMKFVVVGGYAVSAFRHRFSVDADIVIRKEDLINFEQVLKENDYRKTASIELKNIYASEFMRYEKKEPKVSVDLLIGSMASRQTNAAFSFDFLAENSQMKNIEGTRSSVNALVPKREIIIILKLHAGRLTDFRDIAALSFDLDIKMIKENIYRGDSSIVKTNLKKLAELIEKQSFQDSFKGVFMEKHYKIKPDEIKNLVKSLLQ